MTGFGDVAVLMPLAAVIMMWLLLMRSFRSASWWAISVLSCSIVIFVLKLVFYQCPPTPQLHSPSGHTSLSMLVYGAITLVTAAETKGLVQKAMWLGGICLILAIAVSRLLLHVHSMAEVGMGLVIGAASLVLLLSELSTTRRREGMDSVVDRGDRKLDNDFPWPRLRCADHYTKSRQLSSNLLRLM